MADQGPAPHLAEHVAPTKVADCKLLERMRDNPKGDWKISDIETVCRQVGLIFKPPSKGSHFKVRSEHLKGMLTIPAHRPIKLPYIKSFVALVDAHNQCAPSGEG